jgi:hypothetical protein
MILLYTQVSKIGVKRNGIADGLPDGVFVDLKIMFTAFRFLYVNDLTAVTLYYNLRLQCVAFFLPE